MMDVSIVIPAYNEGAAIGETVRRVRELYPTFEVLVVDDGSSDDTARLAEAAGAVVHRHPYNIGNGAAVKSGLRRVQGERVVVMDGDGQHDPADIARLLEQLDRYDLVVGYEKRLGNSDKKRRTVSR